LRGEELTEEGKEKGAQERRKRSLKKMISSKLKGKFTTTYFHFRLLLVQACSLVYSSPPVSLL
jgi:hypothetical protein